MSPILPPAPATFSTITVPPIDAANFAGLVAQTPSPRFFAEFGPGLVEVCIRRAPLGGVQHCLGGPAQLRLCGQLGIAPINIKINTINKIVPTLIMFPQFLNANHDA